MKIELKYQPICKDCKDNENLEGYPEPDCKTCNGLGYTEETIEFHYQKTYNRFRSGLYILNIFSNGRIKISDTAHNNLAPDLNPQSLHIIEEKECPECGGDNEYHRPPNRNCCLDGKIEEETSFTIFDKSQEEYDKKIKLKCLREVELWLDAFEFIDKYEKEGAYYDYVQTVLLEINKLEKELNSEQETK